MTVKEIQKKWDKENNYYRKQEVGSGIHSFVRDFLESDDLFGLKHGSLSTNLESRRNEYIHENKAKEQRQADFVIYINQDIIIPLEAECYGNIGAGIKQILNYQKDFDKQYGILTDGFTWRFYNNNSFREFTLSQIFEDREQFLEFWQEYIKPESYYLAFFEPQGQQSLFQESDKLFVEQNREMFFNDITARIRSFKNKLQIEGYFANLDKKEREKKAVEITYAYLIQFILYKTLVDNDFGHFQQEFEDTVEKIHQYLKENRYKDILGIIDGISAKISENIYRPFAKEQEFINKKLKELYHSIENKLSDVSPWLDIFVFIKKYHFTNIENEIFGYIYENYLKELYEEEKKGQYFTDPAVVNFMLQQIDFTPERIIQRYEYDQESISLIDPSCGSGTFLYSAVNSLTKAFGNHDLEKSKKVEEIVNKNIFGLDIAEFPLYLAEMNILMRMLPQIISEKYNNPVDKKIKVFLTRDSIAEFMNTALKNTVNDVDVMGGQLPLGLKDLDLGYSSYVREETDLEEMKKSLENQPEIPRRRFDFVIGNPPYMHYNECSKQGILVFEWLKNHKASLNNIYGVNLHSTPNNPKRYRPNPNIYAFFIALGIALLKDNGKLCFIIPQTILTAGDLDVIRYHLAKFTTIEKIITFSGKMFVGRGIKQNKPVATSSLVFVINKERPFSNHQVVVTKYNNPNDGIEKTLQNILEGKNISQKRIIQEKLINNLANWNFINQTKTFLHFCEEYNNKTDSLSKYYEHAWAKQEIGSNFYFDGGYDFKEDNLFETPREDNLYYGCPQLKQQYYTIKEYKGYLPNIRNKNSKFHIGLRQANQGYNLLDSKYKIIWSTKNPLKFHFTDKNVVWANIRLSGIGSNNKEELSYLFSLLNSRLTTFFLKQNLKLENEKDFLLPIKAIKEFVRIPKINEFNQTLKSEIIRQTEIMLDLEEKNLSSLVDFSKVLTQKFDSVKIANNNLRLQNKSEKIVECEIISDKNLVSQTIDQNFESNQLFKDKKINLSDLKNLPAIDFEKQKKLKDYIDDLVFALYFNVPIKNVGLNKADEIKAICLKNPHYKIVNGV